MIFVLSNPDDAHCQYVSEILTRKGVCHLLFDFSTYPKKSSISFEVSVDSNFVRLSVGQNLIDCRDVKSVWNRRKGAPSPPIGVNSQNVREYITRESQFFLDSLPQILSPSVFWLSDPDAIGVASRKSYQLLVAKSIGFNIPKTLITNSAQAAYKFLDDLDEVALKTICMPSIEFQEHNGVDSLIMYTKRMDADNLQGMLKQLQNCPTIIQEYVPKKFEIRITVVGDKVFACAIFSQKSERTREDWRHYDLANTPHESFELPVEIEEKCRTLVRQLGLAFGCIDVIVTPQNNYVFLEINPNGQWLWIERLTGLPIGEAIAELLVAPEQYHF